MFDDLFSEDFFKNFDEFCSIFKLGLKDKKTDSSEILNFLETTCEVVKFTSQESQKIKKNNVDLSKDEFHEKINDILEGKFGEKAFKFQPDANKVMSGLVSLPKEFARKFFELSFKLEDFSNNNFEIFENKETCEEVLKDIEELIKEIKTKK